MNKDILVTPLAKVVMILLLLSPVLQTYGWGQYDFASLLTLLLAMFSLVVRKEARHKMPKWLMIYLLFWYLSHIVSNNLPNSLIPLGIIRIFLTYMMFYDYFQIDYFIGKYRQLTFLFLAFFAIQTISRLVFNNIIEGVFTFLPVALTDDMQGFTQEMLGVKRDASFFSEPAHFVQFLLPILAIELFYFRKKSWKRIVAIIAALLLMQSGNALLGLLIMGIFFFLNYFKGKFTAKKIASLIGVLIVTILVGYFYIRSSMGENLMSRQDTISSNSLETRGYAGSGFIRIYRGYYIYQDYTLIDKLIGNDNNEYIKKVINHSYYSWTFNDETYVNTIQAFLLYTGILGLMIFMFFYIKQWKDTNYCGHAILAVFMALSFIAAMHFSEMMAIYLLLPFAMKEEKNIKLIEK